MNKKYIIRALITLSSILILDFGIGKFFDYLSNHQKSNTIFELNYLLQNARPEVIILGSSRARHHYNSKLISEIIGKRIANYGSDGTDIFYHLILLEHLLNKPNNIETIILDIKPQELENLPAYSYITKLYPLTNKMPEILDHVDEYGKAEKIKLLSNAYKYNGMVYPLISGYFLGNGDTANINGFDPVDHFDETLAKKKLPQLNTLNASTISYFKKVAILCKEKNKKIFFCISPTYYDGVDATKTFKFVNEYSKENDISFFHYNNTQSFDNKNFFCDNNHLNAAGAKIFSEDIAYKLIENFKKNRLLKPNFISY